MPLSDAGQPAFPAPDGGYALLTHSGDEQVVVRVSDEAVCDIPPAAPDPSAERFSAYRTRFVAVASDKFDRGEREENGNVWVRSADVR